jgi:hypothetical protein
MKLKYIIPSFMAIFAMLVGCNDKYEAAYMDELRVSSSYLSLSQDGSSTEFTVKAAGNWEIQNIPAWLTVSPATGSAGETTVVISAPASTKMQTATLKLVSGSVMQEINVVQGKKGAAETATCKQVIEGADGKTYRVKGTVTNIANTTYGNWYLDDGTGEIYIYGTLDANGATKNFLSLGIEVGDVVTIEGPKTTYNTTVELVDVTVIEIEKSIVKILDPVTAPEIKKEGDDFTVKLAFKGNLATTVPDDCNWLRYKTTTVKKGTPTAVVPNPADTAFVKFAVDANDGAGRSAVITFACSSDVASSKVTLTVKQAANVLPHGENPDDPFNVAEAIAKCKAIGPTTDGVIYYAKGVISSISSIDTGSYGNATFNISDDGTDENAITCYRSFFLDNAKFTSEDQIKVGDEVIITGKLVNYKETTPEFSGNVYIYALKKGSNDPGTKNNPFTPEEAIAYIDGGGTDAVYVKGIVSELVKTGFDPAYGNGSFWISSDGTKAGDYLKDFEAYQVNYLGGRKWTEADPQIKVGDVVVIYGPVTKYKDTRETQGKGAAYIYSLNGKTN